MKVLILCLLITIVHGREFRFPVNTSEPACKLLQLTASMEIQLLDNDGKVVNTATVDLDKENVTVVDGACRLANESSNNFDLDINNGAARYNLLFTKNSNDILSMSSVFSFTPDVFLSNNDNETALVDIPPQTLSMANSSFTCDAETSNTYKNTTVLGNETNTYQIQITVSNFKVQVYNVQDNKFSDGDHCNADLPTTSSQSTTPTPLPSDTFTFKDPVTNEPCIILQMSDMVKISYNKTNNSTGKQSFTIPPDATVGGQCANDSKASLILTYNKDIITFQFTDTDSTAKLDEIQYKINLDDKRFPDAIEVNETVMFEAKFNDIESKDDTFYECIAKTSVDFTGGNDTSVSLDLSNFRVQAFNVNGTFTGQGAHCPQDTPSTTTVSPASTTSKPDTKPPVNNFTVPDCILMRTALAIDIPYVSKSENTSKKINVPEIKPSDISGNCNYTANSQMIQFKFFDDWTMMFVFMADSDSLTATADKNMAYHLNNISLMFTQDKERFPDAKEIGLKRTVTANGLDQFKVEDDQSSFKCNSETEVNLSEGVKLDTTNFQYRAFNKDNSTNFADDGVNECSADSDSNSVVPIAVGAALAGLVVIVLIAYLIGRRRSKRTGYESV